VNDSPEEIRRLLDRYLSGEATPADEAEVLAWVSQAPELRARLDAARRQLQRPHRFDAERMVAALRERIAAERMPARWRFGAGAARDTPSSWRPTLPLTIAFAAGAIMAALLLPSGLTFGPGREYGTRPGERATITLADGTRAMLAPGSRLVLARAFPGRRDVHVDGEVYFAVTHDPAHPFFVHARNTITRDIGTHFVVRAYAQDSGVRVAVTEGAVAVGKTTLRPGDRVFVARDGATAIERGADVANDTSWTAGQVAFVATPLADVAAALGRWYDLDVEVPSALAGRRFSGTFAVNDPVEAVLQAVAHAAGAHATRRGRQVVFVPNHSD
jgi:transmembrane sensor